MSNGTVSVELDGPNGRPSKSTVNGRPPAPNTQKSLQEASSVQKQQEVHFKASHGIIVAFFTLLLILHVLGIYLFTSGFLLTRLVLEHKSDCSVPPIALTGRYDAGSADQGCWHPKTFNKAVVLIVDALRYDFTVPYRPEDYDKQPHHFHNAFPILHTTSSKQPQNAFLRPFIADPPTTTLQRLKGLTTGTLPTFIDAGSNFAGTAIDEDNLVAQLRNANKRIVHLGDDTWHALFPDYFDPELTHPYDSFNVWDLHTVDNGVIEHLLPLLNPSNTSKWDVIFGHFLGVDHAGHRYGPDHPAMTAKLNQMDSVFRQVIDLLDEDTLLVVMGDHGMDAKGDHGGESDDEIQAALWMYSKRAAFGRTSPAYIQPPAHAKERPVAQIDLVPTLSLLLGMPIPFNNLGAPIEEAFIGSNGKDIENLALVNRLTGAQIHRYQREYARAQNLDATIQSPTLALWSTANEKFQDLQATKATKAEQWQNVFEAFSSYQQQNLSVCRSLWARFDLINIALGIAILISSFGLLLVYARSMHKDRADLTPVIFTRGALGVIMGLALGTGSTYVVTPDRLVPFSAFGAAMGGALGMASGLWSVRVALVSILPRDFWGWLAVVFTILPCIGFASNSYTIWEDEILLFFLSTFGILTLVSSLRQPVPSVRWLGCYHSIIFVLLTRVASLSRLCREEQMPFCKSTYYASATSSTSAPWQLLIPFFVAIILPDVLKAFYKSTESYHETAPFAVGFAYRMGLFLVAVFWTMDAADDGDWLAHVQNPTLQSLHGTSFLKDTRMRIAQLVLAVAFIGGYATYYYAKPMLSISATPRPTSSTSTASLSISSSNVVTTTPTSAITVHGYANVHGTRYLLLPLLWSLAATLAAKPMGTGALALCLWQILSLLEILAANPHLGSASSSSIGPIVLALLGSFHYFKTGHQASLASIQWESAFIPFKTVTYPGGPAMVALNTCGPQILCAVAVPALGLWKKAPKPGRRLRAEGKGKGKGEREGEEEGDEEGSAGMDLGYLGEVAGAAATHLLYYAAVNLATTMWAAHLRRHLMLYRIFSPRFMLGAVVLLVVDVVVAWVAMGGMRWSVLSVAEVFGWS
ncbi:GPI ethanolamine phosphate transferase 3 [Viridothelium virens]|uniref:GPI ethanolamine phosphate transferase 3 n=1 Tax=Viridothelium virens TaxID=1048519 RepID=A0A6A6H2D3_VIRVR|nr:GPI ethanolamine phosphate transferase 3 [Viridothelium virens]